MQPVFHSKRIHSYADVMVNFATMAVDGWQDGEVRKMNGEMMQLTMHIVAKALFDAMLPKYAYFPFGGGPHICIGNAFAAAGAEQAPLALVQNR